MRQTRHPWLTTGLIALLALGGAGAAATMASGAQTETAGVQPEQSAFVVSLSESGDATVTLRLAFDLDDEAAADTFRTLEENATARADRFRSRLATVADRTAETTGRQMTVTNARSETRVSDGVGVIALTVDWRGLATQTERGLRLQEPFASGFEPATQFVVVAPDGGTIDATQPTPDATSDGRVVWAAGTDLSGFDVTVTQAATGTSAPTPLAGVALAVTLAAVAFGVSRRRNG